MAETKAAHPQVKRALQSEVVYAAGSAAVTGVEHRKT
jgi:hypothetical protein